MATIVEPQVSTYQQYIDGEWTDAASGETYDIVNPSTEEVFARAAAGAEADADRAVAAARRSFDRGEWRSKTQQQRTQIMYDIAKHLAERSGEWAAIESQQAGAILRKTSVVDVPLAIEHFRHLAEQALQIPWYEPLPWVDTPAVSWNFVQREPIGVCAGIVPWNFPLMMAIWKIAPALAMGNSVVLKPSPFTPLTALELARAIDETGLLPKGVLNVVTGAGREVGARMVAHPDVDKVAFTGSTRTGREIMKSAADTIKKVTLELGGKSANIVCDDADLSIAVDGALFGTFFHQGQVCESGTRLFVHEKVYDEFMDQLVSKAKALRVGNALDFDTQVGPVVNRQQYDSILRAIEQAKADGATLLCGGGRAEGVGDKGYYIAPTIFADCDNLSRAAQEEIFGPVLVVQRWKDDLEVISRANNTIYGLAGGVWSRNTRRAIDMAKALRTGTVWINDWHLINSLAPFGGYKQSGIGRELGTYGLLEYTEVKHIHVDQGVPREERFFYDVVLG
ncbi:MAG TPA: aldehyde dehydrogenase family protein [Candidatus Dormibacteraeota bacterium]|nr:aldehyde dehydrogenase family protein [Candidatus Dormibacteraeota bacterium]